MKSEKKKAKKKETAFITELKASPLTYDECARLFDVSRATIYRWKTGSTVPGPPTDKSLLEKLRKASPKKGTKPRKKASRKKTTKKESSPKKSVENKTASRKPRKTRRPSGPLMTWDISPRGRPHKKAGNLLIRPYHSSRKDWWDTFMVSKFTKSEGSTYITFKIEKGMKIQNLTERVWRFTPEERDLMVEVNRWLKKNVRKPFLTKGDFVEN